MQADDVDRPVATAPEQEAYWIGVRVGAELSGLVDRLNDSLWPAEALDDEADGTDGMCKLRKLYLRCRSNKAGEDYWEEEEA
jgi:hypothetical protein